MNSMRNRVAVLVFAALAALIGYSSCDAAIGDWHNYTYSNSSNDIIGEGQVIWCATSGGLIKYNTLTGETIKYLNSDGMGDIDLLSLEIDSAGTVFIGGANGTLTKVSPDGNIEVEHFQYSNDVLYKLLSLYADGEVLWVGTEVGVAQFSIYRNGGEFKEVYANLGDIPRETPVRAVRIIGDYLWAGTDSGLAFIEKDSQLPQDPAEWRTITRGENGLSESRIQSIDVINDTIFVGTADGVFWMDTDSTWHDIGPASTAVRDIRNINNTAYIATGAGVYRRNGFAWEILPPDSLITNNAKALAQDADNNLWAAYADGGFASFNGALWDAITIPGPAASYINNLALDSLGNVWLVHTVPGFSGHMGVTRFNYGNSTWQNYNYRNSGIGGNGAVTVEYDKRHDLIWFGSWGDGLFSFDGDTTWRNFDETNSPLRGVEEGAYYVAIPDLSFDQDGNIWMVDLKGYNPEVTIAVFNQDDSSWQAYYENPLQIATNYQQVIYVHGDTIYVCGEGQNIQRLDYGLNALSVSDDTWLSQIQGVEQVKDLLMDDSGRLFICSTSGLYYFDFNYNYIFGVELPDGYRSTVWSIATDGLGNKWVGTDSGVVVLDVNMEQGVPIWRNKFKKSNSFLIDNSVRGIRVDKESGIVYIATTHGLSIYESEFVAPSPDLSDMAVYPNPIYADADNARANFLRVPASAEIYIYTVAGDLVKKLSTNYWDLRNEKNEKVAAGIYFFHVRAGDMSGRGKFAVIR